VKNHILTEPRKIYFEIQKMLTRLENNTGKASPARNDASEKKKHKRADYGRKLILALAEKCVQYTPYAALKLENLLRNLVTTNPRDSSSRVRLVEPFAAMLQDPLGFDLTRRRDNVFAIVAEDLPALWLEIPIPSVVRAEWDLWRVLLVGEQRLPSWLQTLLDLRVETAILLADVLPVLVFVKKAVVEDVAALGSKASLPRRLVFATVRVNESTKTVEFAFVELPNVLHAVWKLKLSLSLVPRVLGRSFSALDATVRRVRPLRHVKWP
jgi:hypothetical protein